MTKLDVRGELAVLGARAAAWASRVSGKGSGGMIGGRVASKIDSGILPKLARGKTSVIVTGTNGKSTTTKMINAALATRGAVAWNSNGDNMLDGVTAAMIAQARAPYASLEVDEMWTLKASEAVHPAAFILLNLSRDQLDRVGEIAKVERRIRDAVMLHPDAVVVANCDDPLIASAAWDCPNVVWVSAGSGWHSDSTSFPRTGTRVTFSDDGLWEVDETYRRPQPTWWVEDAREGEAIDSAPILVTPQGRFPLRLRLPGRANLGNAAQAVACAWALGVPIEDAVAAVGSVGDVAGRYAHYHVSGKAVRVLLAKNPAGWQEALTMIDATAPTVVFAVNGQVADSTDLSWIWDVDFEGSLSLPAGTRVVACGERGEDLAVRLRYAGVTAELAGDPWQVIQSAEPGRVEVLANYTAFRDLTAEFKKEGER